MRHGETEGESSIRYHGSNDVALSAVGRAQIERLRPKVSAHRFTAVVHSPLSRAVTSAQVLAEVLPPPAPPMDERADLREIDFGAIEGMTDGEIKAAMPEWHRAWRAGETDGFPGGDSLSEFDARVRAAVRAVVQDHPRGDLLLVAHRGVVRVAAEVLLDLPAGKGPTVDLGSLTVVRTGSTPELQLVNWRG